METAFDKFKSGLKPRDVLSEYASLFSALGEARVLVNQFARHNEKLLNDPQKRQQLQIYKCVQKVLIGLTATVDSVMILCAHGRAADAEALNRRILEFWYNLLFISTDMEKLSIIYNHEEAISDVCQIHKWLTDKRLSGELADPEKRMLKEYKDEVFKELLKSIKPIIPEFPDEDEELAKKYHKHWSGLRTGEIRTAIEEFYSEDERFLKIFYLSFHSAWKRGNAYVHGVRDFARMYTKTIGSYTDYNPNRTFSGIPVALLNALGETSHCLVTLIDCFLPELPEAIIGNNKTLRDRIDDLKAEHRAK